MNSKFANRTGRLPPSMILDISAQAKSDPEVRAAGPKK
jgi:hypothetical protein